MKKMQYIGARTALVSSYISTSLNVSMLLVGLIGKCRWVFPENVLSAAFEDAVIHEVELNSGSLPVYDEKDVICLHNLVVPER